MRFLLIGLGKFSEKYIKNIHELGSEIVGICTKNQRSEEEKLKLIDQYPALQFIGTNIRTACFHSQPDAVIVCSSAESHFSAVMTVLENNLPVICEKPLCLSYKEAEIIRQEVNRRKVNFICNFTHTFNPEFKLIKENFHLYPDEDYYIFAEHYGFGPFRADCGAFFDWGSHPLSMALAFNNNFLPDSFELFSDNKEYKEYGNNFSINLRWGLNKCLIHTGNYAPEKRVKFTVRTPSNLWVYEDKKNVNSLDLMLNEFISKTESGINFNNLDLAVKTQWLMEQLIS